MSVDYLSTVTKTLAWGKTKQRVRKWILNCRPKLKACDFRQALWAFA